MDIDKAIRRYNKLASVRDERINRPALDEIAAQLETVPPGENNEIDKLLGRSCAVLPERAEYFTPDSDSPREILARKQRADMDDETIMANWPLCAAACQIRRERQTATRWSTDEQRKAWKDSGAAEAVRLATAKQDEYLTSIADQREDYDDFNRMRGDLAL